MLGQGSFSVVYCVHQFADPGEASASPDDGPRALKVIWKDELTEESMQLLNSEVAILRSLPPHPGLVRLDGVFETPSDFCLLQELLDGQELFDMVVSRGHLREPEAAGIMSQASAAVAHLHANDVVHRDLKPENIMIRMVPDPGRPGGGCCLEAKLTDFGLAAKIPPEGSEGLIRTSSLTKKCGSVPPATPPPLQPNRPCRHELT